MDTTVSAAIDRATEQLEAARERDPDTVNAWTDVLRGLEVMIDFDRRLDEIEERVDELWAYHCCEAPGRCDIHV